MEKIANRTCRLRPMAGAKLAAFGLTALLLCLQASAATNATLQPEALTAEQEAAALAALAAVTPASPWPDSPAASESPDPPCTPPATAHIPASLAARLGKSSRVDEANLIVLDAAHAMSDAVVAASGAATWAACSDYTSQATEVCQTELTGGSADGSTASMGSSSLLRLRLNISCAVLTGDSLAVEALLLAPPPLADNQTMQVLHWEVLQDLHPLLGPTGDASNNSSSSGSPPAAGSSGEVGSPTTPVAVESSIVDSAPGPMQLMPSSGVMPVGLRWHSLVTLGAAVLACAT